MGFSIYNKVELIYKQYLTTINCNSVITFFSSCESFGEIRCILSWTVVSTWWL